MTVSTKRINLSRSEKIILLFSFISIQATSGQFISFGLFCLFFLVHYLKRNSLNRLNISVHSLYIIFLWSFLLISLIKFNQEINMEVIIQLFWLMMGLVILVSSLFLRNVNSKDVMDVLVSATSAMGILVLFCYYNGMSIQYIISRPYAGTRIMGGFDGPNELAAFNLFVIIYSINMLLYNNVNKRKYIINIMVSGLIIIYTWSRGGLIGLGIGVFISLFLYFKDKINIKRLIIFSTSSLLGIYFSLNILVPSLMSVRRNASGRFEMISMIIEPILEKPIFGWGLGNISQYSSIANATPHNGYLFILFAGGIVSFVLYLMFLVSIFIQIYKKSDRIASILLLTFLLQELVFNNLIRGRISLLFWLLVVLVFSGTSLMFSTKHTGGGSRSRYEG